MGSTDFARRLSIHFKSYANIEGTKNIVPEINASIGYHYSNDYNPVAVNLGEVTILESEFNTDNDLKEKNIIYLSDINSSFMNITPIVYALTTAHTVGSLSFEGENVLDLGCGCGILGLIAKLKGAKKIIGVDSETEVNNIFYSQLKTNSYSPEDFDLLNFDIRKEKMAKKVKNSIDTVIANIGPHYDGADTAAIRFIDDMPTIKRFIVGGYVDDCYTKTVNGPKQAINMMLERDFKISEYVIARHTYTRDPHVYAASIVFEIEQN